MALLLEEKPIFVIGPERSGTTMLMCMIGSHPRIAVPEVSWYYPRFRPYLYSYGDMNTGPGFRTLAEEMVFGLMFPFFGLKANPRTVVDEVLQFARERSFAGVFAAVMEWYARSQGKPRWGEKTPNNVFHLGSILEDFPNARFVCILRDGRDSCAEYLQVPFGPKNIFCAAEGWKLWVNSAEPWRERLAGARWLDLRYETLVREPERTLRTVCDFLGEDYSPSMLEFYEGPIARARGRMRDHQPLGSPVTDRYVGVHRDLLSPREQRVFAAVAGPEMEKLGYSLDVEPAAITEEEAERFRDMDARIRAVALDSSPRHVIWESYNDWLIDQREERRRQGIWSEPDRPVAFPIGHPDEELIMGMRAWRRWKEHYGIRRRYSV